MKTPRVSLLLGVSVLLLLSGLTDSEVSLNVSPNLQQFFSEASVSMSCVEDGQTVDGWTVKRTKGGQTEECGADGSGFTMFNSSSLFISSLAPSDSACYWCETSSGQKTEQINISVPGGTDGDQVILEIPALPVIKGSDVTLRCKRKDNNRFPAVFFKNGVNIGPGSKGEFTLTSVQQSDGGLYHCYVDKDKPSPQSRLRVKDPPTTSDPHTTITLYTATAFNNTDAKTSSSVIIIVVAVLGSLVLLVLFVFGLMQLCRKQRGLTQNGTRLSLTQTTGPGLRTFLVLTVLPAAGVAVLLYGLTVTSEPPPVSVVRLVLHLVVFCPFFMSTGALMYIYCSRRTGNKPLVSMEMSQDVEEDQGLDKDYDDITADVTTEHNF